MEPTLWQFTRRRLGTSKKLQHLPGRVLGHPARSHTLALRKVSILMWIVTIILENQAVIKDMKAHRLSLTWLLDQHRTFTILTYLERAFPGLKIMIWWCPGHKGVKGNRVVENLVQQTARKSFGNRSRRPPGITAFQAAIKEWVREKSTSITNKQRKDLGKERQALKHMKSLKPLTKESILPSTQAQWGNTPLNHHLYRYQQRHDPGCECKNRSWNSWPLSMYIP